MLSKADVERYNRDGFIVVPNVLSESEVAGLRKATDEIIDKARGGTDRRRATRYRWVGSGTPPCPVTSVAAS